MIEWIVNWAVTFLGKTGYYGVTLLMALESACIPIPSEAILPFGGFLCSSANPNQPLNLPLVILLGALGGTLGSIVAFAVGAFGGRPLIDKLMGKSERNRARLKTSYEWFDKYGEKIVFYSRLLPIVRTFISLPAGISKMNFFKFTILTFIGSLIWSILLGSAGYFLGQHWDYIRTWLHIADYVVVAAMLALIGYVIYRQVKKKKQSA
jgi:membrane protein DedA with SNARE-associated domain